MSTEENIQVTAIKLAVETSVESAKVQKENEQLQMAIQKQLRLISDYNATLPQIEALRNELEAKKSEVEDKQQQLIQIQSGIISTIKNRPDEEADASMMKAIPMVMNRVQSLIAGLTEGAISKNEIEVSVLDMLEVTEGISQLQDVIANSHIVTETEDEKESRMSAENEHRKKIIELFKSQIDSAESAASAEEESPADPQSDSPVNPQADSPADPQPDPQADLSETKETSETNQTGDVDGNPNDTTEPAVNPESQ